MQTWAKRGMQTALVTGGLLVLGTSIASATENVNPDRPAPPMDGGFAAPTHIGNEEADAPTNTTAAHTATQALPGDAVAGPIAQVEQVIGGGLTGGISNVAGSHAGSEWPVLSGNLLDAPATNLPAADLVQTVVHGAPVLGNQPTGGALLRVPLDVIGRAVDHRPAAVAPQSAGEDTQPQFSPLDSADSLLGANQVPVLGDLFTVPNLRNVLPGAPLSTMDLTRQMPALGRTSLPALSTVEQTRQLPVIGGLSTLPLLPTQRAAQSNPAIRPAAQPRSSAVSSHYQPMSGELPATGQLPTPSLPGLPSLPTGAAPVSANLPTVAKPSLPGLPALPTGATPVSAKPSIPGLPSVPSLSALPDLPPVPTLPAMPPIPGRPTTQDLPSLPGLATPSLPTPSLTGPSLPSLPALPMIPGRPTTHDLPAIPALPAVSAPSLFTPVIPAVPALPAVAVPQVQDVPAGSAQQLMAQLRTLITDLENSASGAPTGMHPMQGLGDIQPPAL